MQPDPIEPIVKIGERLREKAAELGLDVQQFALLPDFSGGTSHALQVVFTLNAEALAAMATPDIPDLEHDADLDAMFSEIVGGTGITDHATIEDAVAHAEKEDMRELQRQKDADKESEAVERMLKMRERLQQGKEILGDD